MQFVKLTQILTVITTAATLAGTATAHAEGRRSLSSGGAGLTGLTPAGWVQAPARPVEATPPVEAAPVVGAAPVATTPTVPTGTVPAVPTGSAPAVPTGTTQVAPAASPPVSPTLPAPVPAPVPAPPEPPEPPAAPIPPASGAVSPTDPAPAAAPATPAPPATSNSTTQTITQVQVSGCVAHCDGGNQVQQASQDNTTVQAVGPPVPRDGGASIVAPPLPTVRTTTSTPTAAPRPPTTGVSQVQVGCVEHCYGSTTLDTSGMTLAQIEQLLNELQVPTPPVAGAAPAGVQNTTQQTATQLDNGEGDQSQAAGQTNGTTQVVVTPTGAPADGGAPAAAVNQTAQGIVQLQVGCIFYCSGTQQTQQAQQSNATIQTVDSSGAGAVNSVAQGVAQVQVGCVAWCYDAVESQTATGSDATVVAVAAPPVTPPAGAAPAATTPVVPGAPVPARDPSASRRSSGARSRDSGGAPVRAPVVGLGLGGGMPGAALVPAGAPAAVPTEVTDRGSHDSGRHATRRPRHVVRRHRVSRPLRAAPIALTAPEPVAGPGTATAQPTLELAAVLMLVGLGVGAWRRRLVA